VRDVVHGRHEAGQGGRDAADWELGDGHRNLGRS
jgi:hypothetical protein